MDLLTVNQRRIKREEDKVTNFGSRVAWLIFTLGMLLRRSGQRAGTRNSPEVDSGHSERGDVPGWVMITLMSAVLVAALLALAGPALEALFNQAMDKVGK